VSHRDEVAPGAGQRDVALAVGAERGHAEARKLGQEDRGRMAVVVVGTHADHGKGRMDLGQEGRVRIRRTVVRHLEDVGPDVGPRIEQRTLSLDLGIAG
jgi:hypothetical protein